jgi:hypothetical protein
MVYRRFGAPVSAAIVGLVVNGTANADGCSNRLVSGSYGAQLTGSAGDQSFEEVAISPLTVREMSRAKISSI